MWDVSSVGSELARRRPEVPLPAEVYVVVGSAQQSRIRFSVEQMRPPSLPFEVAPFSEGIVLVIDCIAHTIVGSRVLQLSSRIRADGYFDSVPPLTGVNSLDPVSYQITAIAFSSPRFIP